MPSRKRRRKVLGAARGAPRSLPSRTGGVRAVPGLGRTFLGGLLPGQVAGHLLLWDVIGLSRLSRRKRYGGWGGSQMRLDSFSETLSTFGSQGPSTGLPVSGPVAGGGAFVGDPPAIFFPNQLPPTTLLPPTPDTYFPAYSDPVPDVPTWGPTPDSGSGSSFPDSPFLSPEARQELINQSFYHP